MGVQILGIRHHGVGSAKNVQTILEQINPDIILIEGPPEINPLLKEIGHKGLVPPVAIMVFNSEDPMQSNFYPYAEFSPEWVAAEFANKRGIPVEALDLPGALAIQIAKSKPEQIANETIANSTLEREPLEYLAEISGFENGEKWWEHHFEKNTYRFPEEHFEAVLLAMGSLRNEGISSTLEEENIAREAYMRKILWEAQEKYQNIVIVCGAWHAPALLADNKKADERILKALPKVRTKVEVAWIPWTNSRLSYYSGYGAGIYSPGWSEFQWKNPVDTEIKWLTKVAVSFRNEDFDISTAHVLESYRLAYALAAIRNKSHITLEEINESTLTVMCMGDQIIFDFIREKIIIGEKIGQIPENLPKVPLQSDFLKMIKLLRLNLSAFPKQYDLDLRKKLDLDRSIFFHRLQILGINWAQKTFSRNKGTFKESWVLIWDPEMEILLVDKSYFGNTIEKAAGSFVKYEMIHTHLISQLVEWINECIPAELFESIQALLQKIIDESAVSNDIEDIMRSLPDLINVIRYGDVRNSDLEQIEKIVDRLFAKICIHLPNTCYGLNEETSLTLFELISKTHQAISILEHEEKMDKWFLTLLDLSQAPGIHPVISGCSTRLLFDGRRLTDEDIELQLSFNLSTNIETPVVASWLEGFLRGSAQILIYDQRIWQLINHWIDELQQDAFLDLLPVLRRTFSKFNCFERKQIGEKVKNEGSNQLSGTYHDITEFFDAGRGKRLLPSIKNLLGV